MLTTGMIGGPSIVFCRYAEAGVSKIRSHIYSGADAKICRSVQGQTLTPFTCSVLVRKCLAEKKKFFKLTPRRKTN